MDLKRLVEISPIIGSFLVFMGFFKLYCFYGHWDINIISYLDFSEIILSFLNDLNILVFFSLLLLFQSIVGVGTVVVIDRHIAKRQIQTPLITQVNESSETITVTPSHTKFKGIMPLLDEVYENHPGKIVIVSLIITLVFIILFLCLNQLKFLYFAFAFFVQLVAYFLERVMGIRDDKTQLQLTFIITFVCFTIGVCRYEIKDIELNPKNVVIYTDKETFMTNDTIKFLGKTNNFYFFFDDIQKKSVVYSSGSVQKITQTP